MIGIILEGEAKQWDRRSIKNREPNTLCWSVCHFSVFLRRTLTSMFKCFHPSLGMTPVKIGCKSNKDKQESKALKIEQLLFQSPVLFLLTLFFQDSKEKSSILFKQSSFGLIRYCIGQIKINIKCVGKISLCPTWFYINSNRFVFKRKQDGNAGVFQHTDAIDEPSLPLLQLPPRSLFCFPFLRL